MFHKQLDPDPPAGPGAGKAEADKAEAEAKPKTESPPAEASNFTLPTNDGKEIIVTAKQFLNLAQLGYDAIQQKKKPEEPKEEETIEDKYEKLNKEFLDFKQGINQEKTLNQTRSLLDTEVSKLELVKEMPELGDGIKLQALAMQSLNPQLTLEQAIKQVAVERQKMYENISKKVGVNTNRLKNAMGGTIRGTGNVPVIDKEKKFTAKDVLDGTSRKLMTELLQTMGES